MGSLSLVLPLRRPLPTGRTCAALPIASATLYLRCYQATLAHAVHVLHVEEYFKLIPDDGGTQFFLPYLQRALMLSHAKQLRQDLVRQAIEFESIEDGSTAIRAQQTKF
jgi:hypothetical protein